jgi:RHS repeat-associated protein
MKNVPRRAHLLYLLVRNFGRFLARTDVNRQCSLNAPGFAAALTFVLFAHLSFGYSIDGEFEATADLHNLGDGPFEVVFSDPLGFDGPMQWGGTLLLSGWHDVNAGQRFGYIYNFNNLYAPGDPQQPPNHVTWVATGSGPGWKIDCTGTITNSYDGGNGNIQPGSRIEILVDPADPSPTPTPTATPQPTPDDRNDKPNEQTGGGNGQDGRNDNDPRLRRDDCGSHGMGRYTVDLSTVTLKITDTPVEYTPPRGPNIDFIISYSQRDADQSPSQAYSNLGPNWTFNWLSYVTDDPANPSADATIYVRGGGTEVYSGFDTGTQSYAPDTQSQANLTRTSSTSYEKRFPDGSKFVYSQPDGALTYPRLVFLTQVIDPTGNAATIHYYSDSTNRIDYIEDALGQQTTFSYDDGADPNKITKVTDPFGRYAVLGYTNGQLTSSTDPVGIVSQFGYESGTNFINSLTTPYGTATFETGQAGTDRWLNLTDPAGGVERVEYRDNAPGIAASDPAGTVPAISGIGDANLDVRNTFFWSKKTLATYPPVNGVYDYTKAKIYHWLLSADGASVSPIVSSEKMPLENRVWHTYSGQSDYDHAGTIGNPSQTARVLGDGTTQLYQYEYNGLGNLTKATDPLGRVTSNAYDTNGIDLLTVYQRNPAGASTDPDGQAADIIASYSYNSQHQPLTSTDAAGQTTVRSYTSQGQLSTVTNARNEQTTYAYGGTVPNGYLESVTGPVFNGVSPVTQYTYDSANRVATVTDIDGYTMATGYDNLDRKTSVTYPDGTSQQFQYTDSVTGLMTLDVTGSKDRRGYWTYRHYDGNQHMDTLTDAENRVTHYAWCACGELESITDPKLQITTFHRDIEGRVYEKIFNDNTSITYLFEGQTGANVVGATSRMQSMTDAKSQRTNYTYFADDNIAQVSYTDTNGQPLNPPTPSVSYTYDPVYNRQATMVDGSGMTTYSYKPVTLPATLGANQLASIDGPVNNDTITFSYDELGRVSNRTINGNANSETWSFDSLGRLSSDANKLGTFNYAYIGVTNRLQTLTYPNGITASYLYFPNLQDKRLEEIKNQTSTSTLLSQFDYTYDSEGQLGTWTKSYPGLAIPQRYDFSYDHTDQLLTAPLKKTSNNSLVRQYTYGYDAAFNRTSEQVGNSTTSSTPNSVNEITSQSGATNRTLSYDLNGNLTNDGSTRTYEWDAANRLVAINYAGTNQRSEFSYDGLNRCIKSVEKTGNTVNSTRRFVWCGNDRCEFRNGNGTVQFQLYAQGQYQGGGAYYYTRDHLGSIREMTDASGTVVARYDYDPYGRSNTVIGTTKPDFNFTGLYQHAKSGLDMAVRRFYDPELGRWLNRDPNGEDGGLNLYSYGANDPANMTDLSGLCPGDWWDLFQQFGVGAEEGLFASLDGAIPFFDPFSGLYNANDPGLGFSRVVGGAAVQTLATAGIGEMLSATRAAVAATETGDFFDGAYYGDKVIRQMGNVSDARHAFPESVDGFAAAFGKQSTIVGGDGNTYQILELAGSYRSQAGTFTYIKNAAGEITKRYIIPPGG